MEGIFSLLQNLQLGFHFLVSDSKDAHESGNCFRLASEGEIKEEHET
jgi:hypothetical protein